MSKFVLEILDGPQKGAIYEIDPATPTTIGRKPDNSVVLKDEKCSGNHALVAHEDGGYVLRDLDSRNGTTLDGARVTEIVLSPFDVLQVGRTQIAFREASQSMPTDDFSVETLDASAMARRGGKKRLPIGAILVGLLLLGGGGAWAWIQFGGGDGGAAGGRRAAAKREPERLDGNRLAVGVDNFETDAGWVLSGLESAGFEIVVGRSIAHTGETAIEAAYRSGDADAPPETLAMARLAEPVTVTSDSKLRVRAMMRTGGTGLAAIRVEFVSTEYGMAMTTGTVPATFSDGWAEAAFEVGVPRGVDRAEIQLLALLPDDSAWVRADDVALVIDRESAVEPLLLTTDNGRMLTGAGSTVHVTSGDSIVLDGIRPLVDDPLLRQLDRLGELFPSDAGVRFTVAKLEGGFEVRIDEIGRANGLVLDFASSAAGVLAREGSETPFSTHEAEFEVGAATEVVLGRDAARCALMFEEPVALRGKSGRNGYSLEVEGIREAFGIRVRFEDEAKRARELLKVAERAHRAGQFASALDAVQTIVDEVPHAGQVLRQASALRVGMLGKLGQQAEALRREGAAARFFDARNGYRRVVEGVRALIEKYGPQHVPQLEVLTSLSAQMQAGIEVLDREEAADHRAELEDLAIAFDDAGQDGLTSAIRDYLERQKRADAQKTEGN